MTSDQKVGELGLRLAAAEANGQRSGRAGSAASVGKLRPSGASWPDPSSAPDAGSQIDLDTGANLRHGTVYLGLRQSAITRSKDEPVGQTLLGGRKR